MSTRAIFCGPAGILKDWCACQIHVGSRRKIAYRLVLSTRKSTALAGGGAGLTFASRVKLWHRSCDEWQGGGKVARTYFALEELHFISFGVAGGVAKRHGQCNAATTKEDH
jgi:hypothetical protein